jgi:transitional endoplasmic reticulum ATPase
MQTGEAQLKVMEALQEEAYKGIVRIDSGTMSHINVRPGDIVEIEGSRKTVAIVDRAYPSDVGQAVIRMDGIVRRNAKTGIGEMIKVRAAEVKEAKRIVIAPAQKGVMIQAHPEVFKRGLLGRAVIKGDIVALGGTNRRRRTMSESPMFDDIFNVFGEDFMGNFGLSSLKFIIVENNPKEAVIITDATEIKVNPKSVDVVEESFPEVTYEDIGGLSEEVIKIREMVELPLRHPEIFKRLGIEPPAGVLLHGPPGTGKTLLAKAVANESEANFILINGPEIVNKFYGESEKRLREVFEEAEKNAPSIIFIDEIDAIAPQREEVHGELERRVVAQLLALMDGLKDRGRVVVIAATNRPNAIDPALRRPGRFDREISFGVPDKKGRLNILKIHTRNMPLTDDVKLKSIADITHGFVGADLNALAKEAAMSVLRRLLPEFKLREKDPIPKDMLDKLVITAEDFQEAMKVVRPSALREVLVEIPNVEWKDIGGLKQTKQELKESVEWPLKHPTAFKRLGIKPPRGILLYGPPGTGKTLLAKAVANESQSNFISVKGPELLNKYVGESEKGLRKIFEKARQTSPTIIFFDEIDSIVPRRGTDNTKVTERIVNTMLSEIDGLEELTDVVIVAATNRPDMVDPALLRPGRFDRTIMVGVPDEKTRLDILRIHTEKMPLKNVDLSKLSKEIKNFTGADVENLCREAGILALRENIQSKEVNMKHFEEALKIVKPSVTSNDLEAYKQIEEEYLRKARGAAIKKDIPNYLG